MRSIVIWTLVAVGAGAERMAAEKGRSVMRSAAVAPAAREMIAAKRATAIQSPGGVAPSVSARDISVAQQESAVMRGAVFLAVRMMRESS